jgi:hypothetical protein
MPTTFSTMGLHLHYRLWISELNQDITVLRIFDDYLYEIKNKKIEPEVQNAVDNFKKQFVDFRKEIDELRHLMHLNKMELAAESREAGKAGHDAPEPENHSGLEKRYMAYRKSFDKTRNEFISFEGNCLQ